MCFVDEPSNFAVHSPLVHWWVWILRRFPPGQFFSLKYDYIESVESVEGGLSGTTIDRTFTWAKKITTTVYGDKNAHHMLTFTVTKVTDQLVPVLLVDSAYSAYTVETLSG